VKLALTLFASLLWGFTLNRVLLFALIFSIGILVVDAIVVVENILRHIASGKGSPENTIPIAVNEVGGPTILATLTVLAALLPMAFVSGLMGPYIRPIPINISLGMITSLLVAFIFTPWLCFRLLGKPTSHKPASNQSSIIVKSIRYLFHPLIHATHSRRNRRILTVVIIILILASVSSAGTCLA
jgi:multidrug efflux pump subunit AcrB